jgi:hypothetical protein
MKFTRALIILIVFVVIQMSAAQGKKHRWASFGVGSWAELCRIFGSDR